MCGGGKAKAELLELYQDALNKEIPTRKPPVTCPECGTVVGGDGVPEPEKADMQRLCRQFVEYMITPVMNWKNGKRTTMEQAQVFGVVEAVRGFEDAGTERISIGETDHIFLKKRWEEMGAMEVEIPTDMGAPRKEKIGWGNIGGFWQKVWLAVWRAIESASREG